MTAQGDEIDLANWPVAILAGGLATRLRPVTEKTPKALLSVAGEPFLVHQVAAAAFSWLSENRALCGLSRRNDQGKDWRRKTISAFKLLTRLMAPALLGTGGALRRALPKLGERFLVIYGDSYMPVDYSAIVDAFVRSGKPALMTVLENEGRWDAATFGLRPGKFVAMTRNGAHRKCATSITASLF